MDTEKLFTYVDHTALKVYTDWDEIKKLCEEAIEYHMASVCIPGCYVKKAHEAFGNLNICTVIGFPSGYSSTGTKIAEARQAILDGASELDMVINICDVKNKDYKKAEKEIAMLKEIAKDKVLKVIIETCYLEKEEKIAMCRAVTNAKADYIKTSTGFGTAGATLSDIRLMKEHIGPNVKIKAAGGIRSREDMEAYIKAGCSRIGTSSALSFLLPRSMEEGSKSVSFLRPDILKLIEKAYEAKEHSYAPYSGFHVGAALLAANGKIYQGCNIENAAYSPTNCAERTAFFKAVSEGEKNFLAIAITGDGGEYLPPCGVCRQVMAEFCGEKEFKIILAKTKTDYKIFTLQELLPGAFTDKMLL